MARARRQLYHQSVLPDSQDGTSLLTSADFIVMYFVWRNWQSMVLLRRKWFRSPAYQTKIYSRTLMVTHIERTTAPTRSSRAHGSAQSRRHQIGVSSADVFTYWFLTRAGSEIDCTSIGRRLEDFPAMVEDHNQAVKDLEQYLVKYLKNGQWPRIALL